MAPLLHACSIGIFRLVERLALEQAIRYLDELRDVVEVTRLLLKKRH